MNSFWTWWTKFIQWLNLPKEESAPSDTALLLFATLPTALLTIFIGFAPFKLWISFIIIFVFAMVVRYSKWFHRPESVHLNILGGWVLGQIVNLFIHHTLPL